MLLVHAAQSGCVGSSVCLRGLSLSLCMGFGHGTDAVYSNVKAVVQRLLLSCEEHRGLAL